MGRRRLDGAGLLGHHGAPPEGTPAMPTARPLAAAALLAALAASPRPAAAEEALEPLMDNSFLIEEAYNQEPGVVQHILTFTRDRASGAWGLSFTQELPAPNQTHQLSYTITYAEAGDPEPGREFGDLVLNYRYQAAYEEGRSAFAPRLSAIFPSGSGASGTGYRGVGAQLGLPVSVRLNGWLEAHSNLGVTWVPSGKAGGEKAEWLSWSAGQSFVVDVTPRFNLLLESVFAATERKVGGLTTKEDVFLFSPGFRWGFDLPKDVQVVVGLAVPLGVGPSAGERGVFGYLSVEFPYWHPAGEAPAAK
jgi:hypothetical protein